MRNGISVGWADVYDAELRFQAINVTGLRAGDYLLKVSADPVGAFLESNDANNCNWDPHPASWFERCRERDCLGRRMRAAWRTPTDAHPNGHAWSDAECIIGHVRELVTRFGPGASARDQVARGGQG